MVDTECIKNHPAEFMSMSGMVKDLINKYLYPSTATDNGHIARVRNNIPSTHSNRVSILEVRQEQT